MMKLIGKFILRKRSRIIMLLSEAFFYSTQTYECFIGPKYGLRVMGDSYIVEDVLNELRYGRP